MVTTPAASPKAKSPAKGAQNAKKPTRADRAIAAANSRLAELNAEIAALEAAERELFAKHPRLAHFSDLIDRLAHAHHANSTPNPRAGNVGDGPQPSSNELHARAWGPMRPDESPPAPASPERKRRASTRIQRTPRASVGPHASRQLPCAC